MRRSLLILIIALGLLPLASRAQKVAVVDDPTENISKQYARMALVREKEGWRTYFLVFEAYALGKNDAQTIQAENDPTAKYRRVLELQKAGQARLEILTAVTATATATESENPSQTNIQAVVEAIDEVRYGFTPRAFITANGASAPIAWDTGKLGDTFQAAATVSPDHPETCEIEIIAQRETLLEYRADPDKPTVIPGPVIQTQRIATHLEASTDGPFYLGPFVSPAGPSEPKPAESPEVLLGFLHRELKVPPAALDKIDPKFKPVPPINLQYSWYSMERGLARDLLVAPDAVDGAWEKLPALLRQKKARLEHLVALQSKAGFRCVSEEAEDLRFPAGPHPPEGESPFAQRRRGVTVEVEPTSTISGLGVEVNQAISKVTDAGVLQPDGFSTPYPAKPILTTSGVTTSYTIGWGRHTLVGTFDPPAADGINGRTDTGRTWLLFVRATEDRP